MAALTASCPTGRLDVGGSLTFNFNVPVAPSTITAGNVVVSNAATGVEVPGALAVQSGGKAVTFRPSSPLPYSTQLRVRIQNVVAAGTNAPLGLTVCQLETVAPPLQIAWQPILVSGAQLVGVSVASVDSVYLASTQPVTFRLSSLGDVRVAYNEPHFAQTNDVGFANSSLGFLAATQAGTLTSFLLRTRNGGQTFDSAYATSNVLTRVIASRTAGVSRPFALAGGGTGGNALFLKYRPETGIFTQQGTFSNTSGVSDIAFNRDTSLAAAVSSGFRIAALFRPGYVFSSRDGGQTWTQLAQSVADTQTVFYNGVGVRGNGEIYAVGGNGYVARLSPSGTSFTTERLTLPVTSNFPGNPSALVFTDVEFAPDNDNVGWLIGAQQVGTQLGGVPEYQGLIFETRDGGRTWIRQGVRGATQAGGRFPRLNRIDVFSSTVVYLVGDQGTVLRYAP